MKAEMLTMVTLVTDLSVGQKFWYVERGEVVGPFVVASLTEGRTEEHIVGRAGGNLFEHYAPYNTLIDPADSEPVEATEKRPSCAFCAIATEVPEWALRHGEGIVSFKPFGAIKRGHRLFVPREHVRGAATDPELTGKVFAEAAKWAQKRGGAFNLIVNAEPAGDQSVFHLHVHYVPREFGDGRGYRWHRDRGRRSRRSRSK